VEEYLSIRNPLTPVSNVPSPQRGERGGHNRVPRTRAQRQASDRRRNAEQQAQYDRNIQTPVFWLTRAQDRIEGILEQVRPKFGGDSSIVRLLSDISDTLSEHITAESIESIEEMSNTME
jgi:hypothetical protein